ncbi:phytochrome-like protein [Neurospora crassa]|nr:phytochrome-like protein [Neurospora crassa]
MTQSHCGRRASRTLGNHQARPITSSRSQQKTDNELNTFPLSSERIRGNGGDDSLLSETFEYAILADGSHGVIRKVRRAFATCDEEPIHIPGAIQSYGMLVALKLVDERVAGLSRYLPRICSKNSAFVCHYQPSELLSLDSFYQVMPNFQRHLFDVQLRHIRQGYDSTKKEQEPVVFAFSFSDPDGRLIPCWCAAHYLGGDTDLFICEFELQACSIQSKVQPAFPNPELFSKGFDPSTSSVEVIVMAIKIQTQFSEAATVSDLLETIVSIVKEVTVYQFDRDYNGTVVAELMDPKASNDVYRGLHFPASDIPPQARKLYIINKVRVLFDRSQRTSRLIGRDVSDMDVPLILTHAYLRAMSPVHLKYLSTMGVRSSMSMSHESDGKLWGLIVCHSYGPAATRVPFSIRELSFFVGLAASTCLQKLLSSERLQAHRIIETLRGRGSPDECITSSSHELLNLFDCDCGFLVIEGEARIIGRLSSYIEAITLLKYLFFRGSRTILFSHNIGDDFEDLHFPSGFKAIAGVLYIPLSSTTDDCAVFYRKNQIREVHWAGRPSLAGKIGRLEPRNSFNKWTEVVDGTSKAWSIEHTNLAAMAQLLYGSFIQVWREKETAISDTRLKRLLLHDASHQALEKHLDDGTKQVLTTSYTASKSLIYIIDDLLSLTGSITGSVPLLDEPFHLPNCLEEMLCPLRRLGQEKRTELIMIPSTGPTQYVRGDPTSLQRSLSILVANAIQHTTSGQVVVEWYETAMNPENTVIHISITDTGPGFSERELDDMFQEFEQVPDEDFDEATSKSHAVRDNVLRVGVGLVFVARFVKQRNGQLKVRSTKGRGSTFTLEIPFAVSSHCSSIASRRDASPLPVLTMPGALTFGEGSSVPSDRTFGTSRDSKPSPPIIRPGSSTADTSPRDFQTPSPHHYTVIVADDNMINVQILERRLTKLGHRVMVSRDGQECFNLFASNRSTVDFILMDINMPVVDGFASIRMIRDHEYSHPTPSRVVQCCGRTPIFAVSGMLRRGQEQQCKEAGFDGWMPKPVDMKRLVRCLAGGLDQDARRTCVYDEKRFELGGWFDAE